MDRAAKLGMKPHETQELRVHKLLTGTVVPRPIGFCSSIWPSGTSNAAPFGFFNGISHRLPMICFSSSPCKVGDKGTVSNIKATGDFAVHMVTEAIAPQMSLARAELRSLHFRRPRQLQAAAQRRHALRLPRGPRHAQRQSLFGKMPWFGDRPDSFAVMDYLRPNMQVFVRSDQVRVLVTWPLAPDRCQVVYHSLFPKNTSRVARLCREGQGLPRLPCGRAGVGQLVVQSRQNAMSTRAYRPGSMGSRERGIHHALNNILDRVFGDGADSGTSAGGLR